MSLELIGLSKTFNGDTPEENLSVIEDINYHIGDGEFVSIIGPSGCGKTTLLRIIAGLDSASEGEVLLDKKTIKSPRVIPEGLLAGLP